MTTPTSFSNTGQWIKRSIGIALLGAVATLMAACGGGGASPQGAGSAPTPTVAPLAILPAVTDAYGDTALTFTVTGGKPPYTLATSDPSLLPVAPKLDIAGSFKVTPKTPAFDTNISLSVRDSADAPTTISSAVRLRASTLSSSLTITPQGTNAQCNGGICSGGDGVATVQAVIAGVPVPNRAVRFDAFQGDYQFKNPNPPPNTDPLVSTVTVTTDNQGFARVIIRAKNVAISQSAIISVTDVLTNELRRFVFSISQTTATNEVSIIPSSFTWKSAFKNICVIGGVTNHYVFGGLPPYTVINTSPEYGSLSTNTVSSEGGSFTFITSGNICGDNTIIVRDSTLRNVTIKITNTVDSASQLVGGGPAQVTVPPPVVTPSTLGPIECGASQSAFVTQDTTSGANLTLTAASLDAGRLSAAIANGLLTVTRLQSAATGPSPILVRVSNGVSFTDVPVTLSGILPFTCSTAPSTSPPIVLAASSITVAVGAQVGQTFSGGTAPFSVISSNTTIATVTASGNAFVVRGVASGVTFITISDSAGKTATAIVTVP